MFRKRYQDCLILVYFHHVQNTNLSPSVLFVHLHEYHFILQTSILS